MSYLISCSGKKANLLLEDTLTSDLSLISSFVELQSARSELIEKFGLQLDWERTLPAYKMYKGKLFNKVKLENWNKKDSKIIIVSALFGLINHTDLIPYYDLTMTDKIPGTSELVSDFWRIRGLSQHLNKDVDIDLLFSKYRKAFNQKSEYIAQNPSINWRDKYGSHKGEWLNEQLNLLP